MVVSWLFNTMEPTLRSTITYTDLAKDLWDELQQRFSIANGPRIQEIKAAIMNCRQQGQSVMAYYGKLKKFWDELNNYERIPVCECRGCTCNITSTLIKKQEDEKVHQFIMGLDDVVFGTICSNILSTEPLPNMSQVYAMIIREERHKAVARTREERHENAVSFAVRTAQVG